MPVIRISAEVFKRIQDEAIARRFSFVSPDNVLRAIFGMKQAGKKQAK